MSELKLNTQDLQTMVAKAVKGASLNKMLPLTNLMNIELKDNTLTLTTTDGSNYLQVVKDKVEGDVFSVVVPVDTFSKLVQKTTSGNITLTLTENALQFKGNGKYMIELLQDEDGSNIKYPNPFEDFTAVSEDSIDLVTVKSILESVKPSVATTNEVPTYTNYYVGDTVIGTDTFKIASKDICVFDEPALISQSVMNLLGEFTDENINVGRMVIRCYLLHLQ